LSFTIALGVRAGQEYVQQESVPTIKELQQRLASIESNLARSRRQLTETQELARIGSWEWDIPDDEVWWSDELYRIYGLRPRSIRPAYDDFLARVHPDDRESVDERNRRAFADHRPFADVKRIVRADGREILMRTQGAVICNDAGEPVRMVGICEDVTGADAGDVASARMAASRLAMQIEEKLLRRLDAAELHLSGGELNEAAGAIADARAAARVLVDELAPVAAHVQ
jgi:PAS domain S-box-containing protein